MQLHLIRNATMVLHYAGQHILFDPYFAPKHSRPPMAGISPNPLVELPIPPERILDGVELVIVSHVHADHFGPTAQESVPKTLPLFCQPGDESSIREKGFQEVMPIADAVQWKGIRIIRTGGHHGLGEVEAVMGSVSGFAFQAAEEPTVYWAGDTVLCDEVRHAVNDFAPEVIITHSCGATWPISTDERALIVMDAAQTIEVCRLAPASTVIAVHMEALDHATISRSDLVIEAERAGISRAQLRIPEDGETVKVG
jgi:L-ascorbate metabolism protein UlaG (beta-lactamase superfamily)